MVSNLSGDIFFISYNGSWKIVICSMNFGNFYVNDFLENSAVIENGQPYFIRNQKWKWILVIWTAVLTFCFVCVPQFCLIFLDIVSECLWKFPKLCRAMPVAKPISSKVAEFSSRPKAILGRFGRWYPDFGHTKFGRSK